MPPRCVCSGPNTGTTECATARSRHQLTGYSRTSPKIRPSRAYKHRSGRQGTPSEYLDCLDPLSEHPWGAILAFAAHMWQASRLDPGTWKIQLNGQVAVSLSVTGPMKGSTHDQRASSRQRARRGRRLGERCENKRMNAGVAATCIQTAEAHTSTTAFRPRSSTRWPANTPRPCFSRESARKRDAAPGQKLR